MIFDDLGLIMWAIDRRDVESFSVAEVDTWLKSLLENPKAAYNKLYLVIHGYDNDTRELWEIEGIRRYIQYLDRSFPYFFFFLSRELPGNFSSLKLLLACTLPVRALGRTTSQTSLEFDLTEFPNFLKNHFEYMNEIFDKCGFTEEENKKATEEILRIYTF